MNCLRPLLYFSIFNHPLNIEEIHLFSDCPSLEITKQQVHQAVVQGILVNKGDFYMSNESACSCIDQRIQENQFAEKAMLKAVKRAKFIHRYFPFVKGVGISGSLSKGRFNSNSDADYFIITDKDSLWTCRTLLIAFKKIFLLNSKKFFCVNYFITENALEIEEKNRFTATELVTLIPVTNHQLFNEFYTRNKWVKELYPNQDLFTDELDQPKSSLKKCLEIFFSSQIKICEWFFKLITTKFWHKKFRHLSKEERKIAFKSSKNISKHHPDNYQKKVIDELNKKYQMYSKKFNIKFEKEYA